MIYFCFILTVLALLYAQHAHYAELARRRGHQNTVQLSQVLEQKLSQVAEYQDKVDTLIRQAEIRAGFKIK